MRAEVGPVSQVLLEINSSHRLYYYLYSIEKYTVVYMLQNVLATYCRYLIDLLEMKRTPPQRGRTLMASLLLLGALGALPLAAQDDVTTQNGSSGYNGAWITGPASNPLSFLNGPAFRTTGQKTPYDFPDFAPMTALDRELPSWISFGLEERLRAEAQEN